MSAWRRVGRYRTERERQQAQDAHARSVLKYEFAHEEPAKKGYKPS